MTELFLKILNMSISASYLVLVVVALRFLLKKAPKWINVLLWGMVAFRLICPFTLESALSLIPSAETISPDIMLDPSPTINTGIFAVNDAVNPVIVESFTPDPVASANPLQIWLPILALVWFAGVAVMILYTGISYDRLYRRVRGALWLKENIYQSEAVSTPFILGLFRPRIYLPMDITEPDMYHVTAHERMHIKRKDHWWKPFGFLLLSIHWFNPLMWLAYILLCRDIELACDERAVKHMVSEQRANYSQALLNCSVRRSHIAACPLAFGEVGVKERVKNVLSYKKPAFWVILIALILCVLVAACFLTDPEVSEQLEWIQSLSAADLRYAEYRCDNAALDKQYHLYQEEELSELAEVLNAFDGTPCDPIDPQSLYGGGYTLTIVQKNGQTHTVTNYGNKYLSIDNAFFEDTYYILNQTWDYFFAGTTYLPATENSDLGVSLTIEEVSPTGATIVFNQYDTRKDDVLFGGNDYFLQVKTNDGWEDLPLQNDPVFAENAYSISNIRRHTIDWEWLYGVLPSGHYRIGKTIHLWNQSDMRTSGTVYGEFTITDEALASIYTYHATVLDPDVCSIALYSDGTFVLHQSPLSSYYSRGTYQLDDSQLYMKTDDGSRSYYFTVDGDSFVYDASRSSGIDMTNEATSMGAVPDGAVFTLASQILNSDLAAPKIAIQDVTPTGATLTALWQELPTGVYFRGNDYSLQVWQNDTWADLEPLIPESEITWTSQPHDASILLSQDLDWESLYGSLPYGTYRVCADFHLLYPDSDIIRTAYATFQIGNTIYTPYSATSTSLQISAKDVTPTGLTIVYTPSDVLMSDQVVTDLVYWLERYDGAQWTKLEPTQNTDTPLLVEQNTIRTVMAGSDRHELDWSHHYGSLPSGTYRIGISIYFRETNTQENLYAEFSFSAGHISLGTATLSDSLPLTELPTAYTPEEAAADNVVTLVNGDIQANANIWQAFLTAAEAKQPATVRILKYYSLEGENPEISSVYDLEFDGTSYILHGIQDGTPYDCAFQFLRRTQAAIYPIQRDYDEYDCWYLTNSQSITVKSMDDDRFTDPAEADRYTPIIVYSDLTAYPAHPEIPADLVCAKLDWDGEIVSTVTDTASLKKLSKLLSNAEEQTSGERPYAPGLSLILYPASGEVLTLKLDSASDLIRVGANAYYDYGPNTDARQALFALFANNIDGSTSELPEAMRNILEGKTTE